MNEKRLNLHAPELWALVILMHDLQFHVNSPKISVSKYFIRNGVPSKSTLTLGIVSVWIRGEYTAKDKIYKHVKSSTFYIQDDYKFVIVIINLLSLS